MSGLTADHSITNKQVYFSMVGKKKLLAERKSKQEKNKQGKKRIRKITSFLFEQR